MLDSQAPNVEVVTNSDNDVNNKAAIHSNGKTKAEEHEADLINTIAEYAWPAEPHGLLQERSDTVDDGKEERSGDDVLVREARLREVSGDHLADGIGVYDSDEEDEWDEMLRADRGSEVEVGRDEDPRVHKGEEAQEGFAAALTACFAD